MKGPSVTHARPHRARAGRVLWIVALVALAAAWAWRNAWAPFAALPHHPADFANYHRAARALRAGGSPFEVHNFDYPPLVAFLVLPLAPLSEPLARQLWLGLGVACLLAAGLLLWRLLGSDRAALLAVAAVWAVGGTQAENLVLGQVHPQLLLLVVLSWWGLARARPWLDRLAVALAAALKLWPAVLVLVPALRRSPLAARLRTLAPGLLAVALGVALSWAALLPFPPPRAPASAAYWMGTPALLSFSLPAVALRLADPPEGRGPLPRSWVSGNNPQALHLAPARQVLSTGVALLTLVVGGAFLWRAGRAPVGGAATRPLHASAALVALALAASPIAWYHYQLFQLPGLSLLAAGWWRRGTGWGRLGCLAGLGLLTVALTWSHHLLVGPYLARYGWTAAHPGWLWAATSLVPLASLFLFALHLRELRRR